MKRFWAGLLCLMLLCGAVCAETLNGRNASGNVSIPYGVLNIESEAFAGCADMVSLRIPETVKSLGDGAFRDCPALTTVVIEKGLTTIGACAFAGNGALRSVTLPDSVLSIEDTAFEDCASLTQTVAEGSYAEQYAKKLGIPYTHEQSGDAKVWINRRYMDNLGLVDPVTLDELSEVVQLMMTCDADGNGIADELVAAAATEDDLRLIPQAVGASQEQASLFLASGKLGTYKVGTFSFDVLPLFVVKLEIPAEYQADYEAFEPTLPSVTPTPRPTANPNAKVWINRTFMDNMGLVDPATLDELESVIEIMKSGDPDGNGIDDTIIAAAGNADELCLIPQAVGTTKEQAALFIAAGNLGTTVIGEIDFEKQPLFVVADVIPAEYQADYEAFEPKLPSVTPTPRPTANPNAKVWINRTFMDNMGLVDPATLDELESVIEAMKTGDPDGNGVDDTIIGAAGNADELCLIPQAVGTTKEQAALFIAAGNLRTTVTGEIDFEKQPLFVVTDTIPAAYQAIYERF